MDRNILVVFVSCSISISVAFSVEKSSIRQSTKQFLIKHNMFLSLFRCFYRIKVKCIKVSKFSAVCFETSFTSVRKSEDIVSSTKDIIDYLKLVFWLF